MPHLVILYTGNLDAMTDMPALCRTLCDAMLTVKDETGAASEADWDAVMDLNRIVVGGWSGGGATPPTMTSPTSPSAWHETTWTTFAARIG